MTGTSNSARMQVRRPALRRICLFAALWVGTCAAAQADYQVIHHFAAGADDGAGPLGGLIRSGSTLYGMTAHGGDNDIGVVFSVETDGSEFRLLHRFVSGGVDGSTPYGSLLQSGSMLYGMAGSENDKPHNGTIFGVGTDGTGFQVLHRFGGPPEDGRWPYDSLIQSGSTLYGMTVAGGQADNSGTCWGGTIFRIDTDGTHYGILHHFSGRDNDGKWTPGNLVRSGSALYGMTYAGGSAGLGTIFRIDADGAGFRPLHSFVGGTSDGGRTHGSLILQDSTLYGMSHGGGSQSQGVIFRIGTDGEGFQPLHSFAGGDSDGALPIANSFVRSGSTLYGMTTLGGADNKGVIFQMNTDGTGFRLLHTFSGADGAKPFGSLLLSDSSLYGMTSEGGSHNLGVLFALNLPTVAASR